MEIDMLLEQVIEKAAPDSIGRPKTLEDVLRALEKLCEENEYIRKYRPFLGDPDFFYDTKQQWTLGLPLSDQSPETIAFLHQLLCK